MALEDQYEMERLRTRVATLEQLLEVHESTSFQQTSRLEQTRETLEKTLTAMRESEALLQSVMRHSPTIISLKDEQGRYILVNPAFERVYGVRAEEVKGKSDHDLFATPVAEPVVAMTSE